MSKPFNPESFGTEVPVGVAPSRRQRLFDLAYYEGPLSTVFVAKDGKFTVYHWCEANEEANRWYATMITLDTLLRYVTCNIGTRRMLMSSNLAFLVDIGREEGKDGLLKAIRAQMFNPADGVPEPYMPSEGAEFDADLAQWEDR